MEFVCKYTGSGNLDYLFFHRRFELYKVLLLTSELLLTDNPYQQKFLAKIRQLHANKPKSLREGQCPRTLFRACGHDSHGWKPFISTEPRQKGTVRSPCFALWESLWCWKARIPLISSCAYQTFWARRIHTEPCQILPKQNFFSLLSLILGNWFQFCLRMFHLTMKHSQANYMFWTALNALGRFWIILLIIGWYSTSVITRIDNISKLFCC